MHEAREILWAVASADVARPLNPQEERLLSDLLQREWPALDRLPDDEQPEIPGFLIGAPND
jgi:hypothetical protein